MERPTGSVRGAFHVSGDESVLDPEIAELTKTRLRAEIKNLEAAARKAEAEADNADAQQRELKRRRSFFERLLSTTQVTVVLGLATLMAQVVQFWYTGKLTRQANEAQQWESAVGNVSFDGDAKSVKGALDLETFLSSDRYGEEARTMVAAVIPSVGDTSAFDHLFTRMVGTDGWESGTPHVYTVAKALANSYGEAATTAYQTSAWEASDGVLRRDVSDKLDDTRADSDKAVVDAARMEWELDTVTRGLLRFWEKNRTKPKWAKASYKEDLGQVMLRLSGGEVVTIPAKSDFSGASMKEAFLYQVNFNGANLSGVDLSGSDLGQAVLAGVNLSGANVRGANLDQVGVPVGSNWTGVRWWEAKRISPELCGWLRGGGGGVLAVPAGVSVTCGV